MQETRQHILDILRENGQATVDDIVAELQKRRGKITAVTVRHHLNVLQQEQLIATSEQRHRATPGRPQHVYALTDQAQELFQNNYQTLVFHLIRQLKHQLSPQGVNVMLDGVVHSMAQQANIPDVPLKRRLDLVVDYLNQQGYNAHTESTSGGFLLHTTNCPYHQIARESDLLCTMDMQLVAMLLGVVPRLMARVAAGDAACSYFIPGT